jgi:hypothetical protein
VKKSEVKDSFDKEICVSCGNPCHFGSGRFVDRYPSYGDEEEGWVCGFCAVEAEQEFEKYKGGAT